MTTGGGVRAAFSPDGGTLAVASADGRLKTFDTGEKREWREKEKEESTFFWRLAFFFVAGGSVQRPLALSLREQQRSLCCFSDASFL